MPIVWFSLFFIIFSGFFQYDRCIAEQDGKTAVMRASEIREKDEAKVIRKVMERGDLAGSKKLLFSSAVGKDFHIAKDRVSIKISGRVNTVLNDLVKGMTPGIFTYAAEYGTEQYDPVRFIRMCRRIEKYAGS